MLLPVSTDLPVAAEDLPGLAERVCHLEREVEELRRNYARLLQLATFDPPVVLPEELPQEDQPFQPKLPFTKLSTNPKLPTNPMTISTITNDRIGSPLPTSELVS